MEERYCGVLYSQYTGLSKLVAESTRVICVYKLPSYLIRRKKKKIYLFEIIFLNQEQNCQRSRLMTHEVITDAFQVISDPMNTARIKQNLVI